MQPGIYQRNANGYQKGVTGGRSIFRFFDIRSGSPEMLRGVRQKMARIQLFAPVAFALLALTWPQSAFSNTLKIQRSSSSISFQVGSFWGDVDGRFNTWDSTIKVNSDFSRASGEVKIQVASIDTGNSGRDEHLRDPDFFAVTQFPVATYAIQSMASTESSVTTQGTLTIRGKSQPLQIVFRKQSAANGIRLIGSFTINRKTFGVNYDSMMNPIDDSVRVHLSILLTESPSS